MRNRIFVLVTCIGLLLVAGGCGAAGNEEKDMYSGTYVDRQGTEDIFSELELRYLEEGMYEAFVGIFRVGASEGIARAEGEILLFEAEGEPLIRGEICIQDSEAVLTITESEFDYIQAGQVFIFSEKLHEVD